MMGKVLWRKILGLIKQWVEEKKRMREGSKESIIAGRCVLFLVAKNLKRLHLLFGTLLFSTFYSCLRKAMG